MLRCTVKAEMGGRDCRSISPDSFAAWYGGNQITRRQPHHDQVRRPFIID
jgi:hypothetical protein